MSPRALKSTADQAPAVAHAGACRAVKLLAACTCLGYVDGRQVGLYRQCVCGHTQQSHALIETTPAVPSPKAA